MAVKCEYCGKEIQNRQALEVHKRYKHSLEISKGLASKLSHEMPKIDEEIKKDHDYGQEEYEYGCGGCGFEFNERRRFCPECGVEFGYN